MNDGAFATARGQINHLPCVFEKALLSRNAVCRLAAAHSLGERAVLACTAPVARAFCGELAGLLRQNSVFALKLTDSRRVLTHAMAMKIECGGLLGMKQVLDPEAPAVDVHGLILLARERHGELAKLPFGQIVQGIAAWRGRQRAKAGQ